MRVAGWLYTPPKFGGTLVKHSWSARFLGQSKQYLKFAVNIPEFFLLYFVNMSAWWAKYRGPSKCATWAVERRRPPTLWRFGGIRSFSCENSLSAMFERSTWYSGLRVTRTLSNCTWVNFPCAPTLSGYICKLKRNEHPARLALNIARVPALGRKTELEEKRKSPTHTAEVCEYIIVW